MKILYSLSQYISHYKAGNDYIQCLHNEGYELVDTLDAADIVIIHDEPPTYPLYYEKYPQLREKYVIAYAVWETDLLPSYYINGLDLVDEIWTCSEYTKDTFLKYFPHVYTIPHVISAPSVTEQARETLKEKIAYREDLFYFYTIIDSINPRKNINALLEAYSELSFRYGDRIAFIIKQYRKALDVNRSPRIISINEFITDEEISALHDLGNCFVSAHCSEAWGLSISDALAAGNLVVATGYGGNMEYMNEKNSFPVKYDLSPINEKDLTFQPALLSREMQWAYIKIDDLIKNMDLCYTLKYDKSRQNKAQKLIDCYNHAAIGKILKERLDEIKKLLTL